MHIAKLALSLLSLSLVTAHAPPHHRHLGTGPVGKRHTLEGRAGGAISNDTIGALPSDEANMLTHGGQAASSSTATSSAAGESGQAGDIITPSTAQTSSSTTQATTSSTSTTAVSETPVASQSSTEPQETQAPSTPSEESSVAPSSSSTPSAIVNVPQTLSSVSPTSAATRVLTSQRNTYVTTTRTASGSSTASVAASNSDTEKKSGGLSKTALIAIIVVASVVGAGAILVFAIRKFKLRKSNRFDDRMKPIDFSPYNDGMGNDDFLEKTLQRTASNASADRQRQQFVKELETDPNYVAGVPDHDFTAGAAQNNAGYGAYDDGYNNDPFARAQMYEYDQNAYYQDDPHAYPPAAGQHVDYGHAAQHDYPTQDQPQEGYADLQRGNSNGSDHARSAAGHAGPQQYTDFPSPDNYIGRPTGGIDGPYAQAAQYRSY